MSKLIIIVVTLAALWVAIEIQEHSLCSPYWLISSKD